MAFRKIFITPVQVLSIGLLVSGCGVGALDVLNSVTPNGGFQLTRDISYGNMPRQTLDLFKPNRVRSDILIVFVYGGAWKEGSKADYKFVGESLTKEGYTVAIPDYRLYPDVVFPDIIDDVRDAVIFLRDEATNLSINSETVVLVGHSSGAHAAAMLVSSDQYFKAAEFISGFIGISGPYSLPLDNPEVEEVFMNVHQGNLVRPPKIADSTHPPTLLLHGLDDDRVLPFHTEDYSKALRKASVPVRQVMLEGVEHADILAGLASRLKFLNSTREEVLTFLKNLPSEAGIGSHK